MTGAEQIEQERVRQIEREGFCASHDKSRDHTKGQLSIAAACYAVAGVEGPKGRPFVAADKYHPCADAWPWGTKSDKREKHNRMRRLVIAGALIAAEIDRLQAL